MGFQRGFTYMLRPFCIWVHMGSTMEYLLIAPWGSLRGLSLSPQCPHRPSLSSLKAAPKELWMSVVELCPGTVGLQWVPLLGSQESSLGLIACAIQPALQRAAGLGRRGPGESTLQILSGAERRCCSSKGKSRLLKDWRPSKKQSRRSLD